MRWLRFRCTSRMLIPLACPLQVDKKIAIAHEKVLEKGRQVHKVLEREVHPEQVYVRTTSKADKWGLRCVRSVGPLTAPCLHLIPIPRN